MQVDSPWGDGGGVVKTVEDVELMAATGVGWIEAGSYTLEQRFGNDRDQATGEFVLDPLTGEPVKVYYHDSVTGKTINSLGMPNKGMDVVETEIPEMLKTAQARGKELVVNVAPVTDDPVAETQELVERVFEAGAENVLVNAGCPNVVTEDGGRHEILSHNPDALRRVLVGLKEICGKNDRKVFVRLSPYPSRDKMAAALAAVCQSEVVSAVYTPNTWPGQLLLGEDGKPILGVPGGGGGLSGPAQRYAARQQTSWAHNLLKRRNSRPDIVSSSSIMTGQDLLTRMRLGAVAGAGTTFYYESSDWKEDTDRLLHDFARAT